MDALRTDIADVLVFEPRVFSDERGFLFESWNAQAFTRALGVNVEFVQDNHSRSARHVLRGLHYQIERAQAKLVRVVRGKIFDVAVDLRKSSPNFGRWVGTEVSEDNRRHVWIPQGFAHGFLVLSDSADVLYKTTEYYAPEHERCIVWNDPDLGIAWPLQGDPILSWKDRSALPLRDAQLYP
jgi:dTDP-4-dehydrorhamnose 3,5-epimerase